MSLTTNSTIEDLVLEIGKIIVESDGKNDTMVLDIPDQKFYLEIAVKVKEVEWWKEKTILFLSGILRK